MPLPSLPEPKKASARWLGFIKGWLAAGILIPLIVFINVLQTASLLIKPFSSKAFRSINRWFANFWWGLSYVWAEKGYGVHVEITGDEVPMQENALLVSNHQEMPDIPVLFKLAYQKKRLGDLKWYVKDIIKYIPGIGWGMLFLDCLFVKRNWTADKKNIDAVFANILKNDIPVWIISFVEGTRIRPSKLERSNAYAEKSGQEPTRHVLLPRTKGFTATALALYDHLDAVYDLTIAYENGVPTIWQWFKGYATRTHLHVRRFPMDTLPKDEQALSDWLTQRFYIKDERLERYYSSGILDDLEPKPNDEQLVTHIESKLESTEPVESSAAQA